MNVVPNENLLAPSICFICEASNPVPMVDTERTFLPQALTALNGRKYLCRGCVEDAANLFGFMAPEKVAQLQDEVRESKEQLALEATKAHVTEVLQTLVGLFPEKPKPTRAAKAPSAATA